MYYGASAVSGRSGIERAAKVFKVDKVLKVVMALGTLVVWASGCVKNEGRAKNF